jgi:hypothetical protein
MAESTREKMSKRIYAAKLAYERKEPYFENGVTPEDLVKNLRRAKKRQYNGELVQLALIGHQFKTEGKTSHFGLKDKEKKAATFLAQVFEEGVEPIWYLEDLCPNDFYRMDWKTLIKIRDEAKPSPKRPREDDEDPEESAKRTCLIGGVVGLSSEDVTSLGGEWCDDTLDLGRI